MANKIVFYITLVDCNGQNLATWTYDEYFPVTPPVFTYPNDNDACPYIIRFQYLTIDTVTLSTKHDINYAIKKATEEFLAKIRAI